MSNGYYDYLDSTLEAMVLSLLQVLEEKRVAEAASDVPTAHIVGNEAAVALTNRSEEVLMVLSANDHVSTEDIDNKDDAENESAVEEIDEKDAVEDAEDVYVEYEAGNDNVVEVVVEREVAKDAKHIENDVGNDNVVEDVEESKAAKDAKKVENREYDNVTKGVDKQNVIDYAGVINNENDAVSNYVVEEVEENKVTEDTEDIDKEDDAGNEKLVEDEEVAKETEKKYVVTIPGFIVTVDEEVMSFLLDGNSLFS